MLLALALMLRVSDLASINLKSIKFTQNKIDFSLSSPRKSQRWGRLRSLRLKRLSGDSTICSENCLERYILVTESLLNENNDSRLFVCIKKPHKPATAATLGRWLKFCLGEAGIDTTVFSAHSTRGASASAAFNSGVPLHNILRTADWTSESTFANFYHKNIVN